MTISAVYCIAAPSAVAARPAWDVGVDTQHVYVGSGDGVGYMRPPREGSYTERDGRSGRSVSLY